MALQSSGAISLGQIAAEYVDGAPHRLSEFRGLTQLPTGTISFSDFYGKTGKAAPNCTYGHRYYPGDGSKFSFSVDYYGFEYRNNSSNPEYGSASNRFFERHGRTLNVNGIMMGGILGDVYVQIRGFGTTSALRPSSDDVFSSLTKNGVTVTPADASNFGINGDKATWTFPSANFSDLVYGNNVGTFKLV